MYFFQAQVLSKCQLKLFVCKKKNKFRKLLREPRTPWPPGCYGRAVLTALKEQLIFYLFIIVLKGMPSFYPN